MKKFRFWFCAIVVAICFIAWAIDKYILGI